MANFLPDEVDKLRKLIERQDILGAHGFVQESMHVFKVAVAGASGSGKSSFVNAILGLEADDIGAAGVGVVETTMSIEIYPHPENKNLIIYDLPGIGSYRFSKRNYFDMINISQFDFFVILSAGRFTELDLFVALKVQEYGKVFYFVRSKIDIDLMNEKRSHAETFNETAVLNKMREDCIQNLDRSHIGTRDVFLINNYDRAKFDFPRLNRSIVKHAPLVKIDLRERVLSSLVNGVYQKKREFAKSSTVPVKEAKHSVPNAPIYVDAKCIREEIEHFKQEFSLNEQAVAEYAALMDMSVVDMTKNLSLRSLQMDFSENGILMACAELYPFSKINFPFFGSFLSSRSVVTIYLGKVIDQMCDDAIKLNMALISRTRNKHSESSSTSV